MKPVKGKTQNQIFDEWNEISFLRNEQIETGKDISYLYVLLPSILKLIKNCDLTYVIDIGCGTGYLTQEIAKKSKYIIGIDKSGSSIDLAKDKYEKNSNLKFINSSLEEFSLKTNYNKFTLAIANMSLMSTLNLENALYSISKLLKAGSNFIFTISHPCFWQFYWDYSNCEWFNYNEEIPIEAEFQISLEKNTGIYSTHIHRSLEFYMSVLLKNNFIVEQLLEPFPDKELMIKYPVKWKYPHFLCVRCIKA